MTNTQAMHSNEQAGLLAGLEVGDELLVRRRNGGRHVYTLMQVSQVKDTFVTARRSDVRSTIPGQGVVSFRVSDGVESASGGSPRRAWPIGSDAARDILADDPKARRQIEQQRA